MIKRPLCLAALFLALILLCLPAELWIKDPPEGAEDLSVLTGTVSRIEPGGTAVWLTHTNFSDTGIIRVSFEAETHLSIGNTLRIDDNFKIQEPERPTNPGQFDARLYYQTKGIIALCYAKKAEVIRAGVRPLPQLLYEIQEALSHRVRQCFPEEKSGVVEAMLLGNKADLEAETKSLYQKSGISHLLAISGLHISLFGMSLYRILRKIGADLYLSGTASLLLVLFYGGLTGMGVSTGRAVLMFALLMVGTMLGKSYDMLTALALGAIGLLLGQPLYVRSASFLLSFGAVLGVGLLFPVLKALFLPEAKLLARLTEPLLLSLSIQLMTLPILEYFYSELPVYGILLNLVVIPLMTVVMLTGLLTLAVSFALPSLTWLPAFVCVQVLELYERLGTASLKLPGAVYLCGQPGFWQMALYYLGLTGFLLRQYRKNVKEEKPRRLRQVGSGTVLAALALLLTLRIQGGLTLVMLDVGQGDGIFLRTGAGTTLLIDGGSTSVSKVGAYRIAPFLKAEGVGKLDYVVITHTDEDHISGIKELLERTGEPGEVSIKTLLLSGRSLEEEKGQRLAEMARKQKVSVRKIGQGAVLSDTAAMFNCLHPSEAESGTDVNEASVTLALREGSFSVILTGDLGEEGEQKILERERELGPFTILKAGHHGSSTSGSEAWLQKVRPMITLISCGRNNSYGHPHRETLERLEAIGSKVWRTDRCGAIRIKSDGKKLWIRNFL